MRLTRREKEIRPLQSLFAINSTVTLQLLFINQIGGRQLGHQCSQPETLMPWKRKAIWCDAAENLSSFKAVTWAVKLKAMKIRGPNHWRVKTAYLFPEQIMKLQKQELEKNSIKYHSPEASPKGIDCVNCNPKIVWNLRPGRRGCSNEQPWDNLVSIPVGSASEPVVVG